MIIFLSAIGCGGKVDDTSSPPLDDTAVVVDDTDPCEGIEGNSNLGMNGTIEFANGTTAQGNVRVQMCNENLCYVAKWSNESDFCFPVGTLPANMPYAFDLVPTLDGGENYAQPLSILNPTESFTLPAPVVIPEFSGSWTSSGGSTEFTTDNGLTIIIGTDYEEDTLSAIAIDLENGGLPLEGFTTEEILGGWYLGPFDTHVSAMDIQLQNESITEGVTYKVYNGDYEGKQWLPTAEITATEDGQLSIPSAISILSTLLITQ